jgi:hypothetical protein
LNNLSLKDPKENGGLNIVAAIGQYNQLDLGGIS